MVVTFVTGSLEFICETLDRRRLNKQKVEASQILRAFHCEGGEEGDGEGEGEKEKRKGWVNHPAVKMWVGYPNALKYYFNAISTECVRRGFKNNMPLYEFTEEQLRGGIQYQTVEDFLKHGVPVEASTTQILFPWWFQWRPLQFSHQASLLRKDPAYYGELFLRVPDEYTNTGYVWPHRLTNDQIEYFTPAYCDPIGTGAPATYRWTKAEVETWLENEWVNPTTGRAIKQGKTGIYADLKKAAKLYGL